MPQRPPRQRLSSNTLGLVNFRSCGNRRNNSWRSVRSFCHSCWILLQETGFGCMLMPPGVDSNCCWTSLDRSYPALIRPTPSPGTHIRSPLFPWERGCSLRVPSRTQLGRSELRRVISRRRRVESSHESRAQRSSPVAFRERNCESGNSPFYDIVVECGKTQHDPLWIGPTQHEPIKPHRFYAMVHCCGFGLPR